MSTQHDKIRTLLEASIQSVKETSPDPETVQVFREMTEKVILEFDDPYLWVLVGYSAGLYRGMESTAAALAYEDDGYPD